MKICVFGAGAIGGYMGVKLAQAGADGSLVARGPHFAAMQAKGLTLFEDMGTSNVAVTASDEPTAEVPKPGVIKHVEGNRFSLGEPDGSRSRVVQGIYGRRAESAGSAPAAG